MFILLSRSMDIHHILQAILFLAKTGYSQLSHKEPPFIASNFRQASQCFQSWRDHQNEYDGFEPAQAYPITMTYETIKKIGQGSVYTCQDGIPRYKFDPSPTAEVTSYITATSVEYVSLHRAFNESQPNCIYAYNDEFCDWFKSIWSSDVGGDGFNFLDGLPWMKGVTWHERGCAEWECEMDLGDEVVLIYWPSSTTSNDSCALDGMRQPEPDLPQHNSSRTYITSAITFNGQDFYTRGVRGTETNINGTVTWDDVFRDKYIRTSVMTGPFTFVSPTVYLAHHPIYARSTFSKIRRYAWDTIRPAGILPLSASDVFSIRPTGGKTRTSNDYAKSAALGQYSNPWPYLLCEDGRREERDTFNFNNLADPVPASVYFDARTDCWGEQTHCATITDGSYRPRLAIRDKVWLSIISNNPYHRKCVQPILDDPAIAISPLTGAQRGQPSVTIKPAVPPRETQEPSQTTLYSDQAVPARPGNAIGENETSRTKPTAVPNHGSPLQPDPFDAPEPDAGYDEIQDGPRITSVPRPGTGQRTRPHFPAQGHGGDAKSKNFGKNGDLVKNQGTEQDHGGQLKSQHPGKEGGSFIGPQNQEQGYRGSSKSQLPDKDKDKDKDKITKLGPQILGQVPAGAFVPQRISNNWKEDDDPQTYGNFGHGDGRWEGFSSSVTKTSRSSGAERFWLGPSAVVFASVFSTFSLLLISTG